MSLVAFAVRIAAVRILRAALPGAFLIVDSPVDPVDSLETNPESALIAVYTGQTANKLDGVAFFAGEPILNLDLQIFLPQQMTFTFVAAAGGAAQVVTLDTRGAGSETALDMVARMITRAISAQGDPWAVLFAGFVQKVRDVIASSYLVETGKVKAVAREIRMSCDVLQEPVPGAAAGAIWADLLTAMRADTTPGDNVAALAPWIDAEINNPAGLSQAEVDRIFLGLSEYAAQSINLTATLADSPPLPLAEQADTITETVADAVASIAESPPAPLLTTS